jgi:hypothetical protein
MSETDEHLDIDELKKGERKGWFVKEADDMPEHRKFRRSCKQGGRGFLGPNFGAHHIIPQYAIGLSTRRFDPVYIEDIKYITPYILNRPSNMVGLPSFWSYDVYYEALVREKDESARPDYPGASADWKDSYSSGTRELWRSWVAKHRKNLSRRANPCPENNPIHVPVSWGHTEYNEQVATKLEQQVWKVLKREKSKHKISKKSFEAIQAQLQALETALYQRLMSRGATSPALWERRKDATDNGWYGPYTMTDIKKNPIWG